MTIGVKQAFALGLACADKAFRKDLVAKVLPDAFEHGPARVLFEAIAKMDAKLIIASLANVGIDLQQGEKLQAYLLRTLAEDGKRERVESILCRARTAKTFGGPEDAMAVLKIGVQEWDAKEASPEAAKEETK